MKKLLIIFTSILALAGDIFAQMDKAQDCPKFGITGPSVMVAAGDTATYTAHVDSAGPDLRYQWSISAGEITSGQGTPIITVKQPIVGVTVTVEIIGLPKGCPNMISEASIGDPNPEPELLQSFSGRIRAKDKARYNEIYDRLAADPNGRGVIFLAGTVPQIKANKKMIVSFVTRLFKDAPRVIFIDVESQNEMTEVWFVRAGADDPKPGKFGSQIILRER
jgi:hypothetical protein